MLGLLNIAIGGGLLLAGRRLFWLFVGAVGFLIGLEVARLFVFPSELILILAALGLGLAFALFAVFVESVAIGVAGFLGGGITMLRVAALWGFDTNALRLVAFIVGGIIGVILVVWLFNWALITISSVAGASMIVSGLFLRAGERPLLFLGLAFLGIVFQGLVLQREGSARKTKHDQNP